jgi:phosphate transport system substrate-binding protein
MRPASILAAAASLAFAAGCGAPKDTAAPAEPGAAPGSDNAAAAPAADAGAPIAIDGSSTVHPILEAVAEEWGKQNRDARVTVGVSGTGGGFKKLCAGEIVIAGASRPIKQSESDACAQKGIEWLELPVAYDGLAVVVNPQNTWVDQLTVAELKAIWEPEAQGKVTRWEQVRAGFPKDELHLFGPGVDSGTYDYFTHAIVGKEHSSRGDYTASEDDEVLVQGVASDKDGLGFFGYAYFEENKERLKLVPVDDGKDENGKGPIAPSPQTVADGSYQPLSRPIFVYVAKSAAGRPEVASFVGFLFDHAATLVPEVGYVALPPRAYELARGRWQAGKTGSMFTGGSQTGVTVEQLLAKEQ